MKKLILLLVLLLSVSIDGNSQWYTKKYGVTSLNQLTREQLEISLTSTKTRADHYLVLTIIGGVCIGVGVGVVLMAANTEEWSIAFLGILAGGAAIGTGPPLLVIGVTGFTIMKVRISDIKEALANLQVKTGFINNPVNPGLTCIKTAPCPGISVTFNF